MCPLVHTIKTHNSHGPYEAGSTFPHLQKKMVGTYRIKQNNSVVCQANLSEAWQEL